VLFAGVEVPLLYQFVALGAQRDDLLMNRFR
jgi:hypothetical protein